MREIKHFINGAHVAGTSGRKGDVFNPATGEVQAQVTFASDADLQAAVDSGLTWLAIGGVIASVVSAFYYLRIVYYMYFGQTEGHAEAPMSPAAWVALMGSAAIMILGVVNLFGIETAAAAAAQALVN